MATKETPEELLTEAVEALEYARQLSDCFGCACTTYKDGSPIECEACELTRHLDEAIAYCGGEDEKSK